MGSTLFNKLAEKYPFISLCRSGGNEYVGIIQNRDELITSMYDYGDIVDIELKLKFLELAHLWWWESRRTVPINIFLKEEWAIFKPYIRTFMNKDLVILHGPCVSLSELNKKRSKRKSITLVRRIT